MFIFNIYKYLILYIIKINKIHSISIAFSDDLI